MTEQSYVTLRATEPEVNTARDVKQAHGDTWTDVLTFYAEHRPEHGHAKKWTERELRALIEQVIEEYAR